MNSQVLYRKYRPRHFNEVVGQEHVVQAITNALRMGRIAHAYLFSGPRGVGKTTVARLIAKSLNCLKEKKNAPCNACASCDDFNAGRALDLIEIDAASNRGIDEIRELREGVRFVPSSGEYKTYVIDECHQLTKEAFNALLKTLEEPPSHAVFVLATTELEKVPPTIVSRTQHYDFRRLNALEIANRLSRIAQKEGAALDQDASRLIAFAAEGSVRDAESILGKIMTMEDAHITRPRVEEILGLPRRDAAKKLFELIAKKDAPAALALVQEVADEGYDLGYFSKLLIRYLRGALFLKTDPGLRRFVEQDMLPDEVECISANIPQMSREELSRALGVTLSTLQQFRKTPIPQLPLEVSIVEIIHGSGIQKTVQ